MRALIVGFLLLGACGSEAAPGEGKFVAAMIDGVSWRATGEATTHFDSRTSTVLFGIRGYTPLPPSDVMSNAPAPGTPRLNIGFTGGDHQPGSYDIATTADMTVTYGPDENRSFAAQTGTVVISRIDQSGVDGTFSFTGRLTPDGPDTVAVTRGSFSAPIGIVP